MIEILLEIVGRMGKQHSGQATLFIVTPAPSTQILLVNNVLRASVRMVRYQSAKLNHAGSSPV